MKLKMNAQDEFAKTFKNEVVPLLRKQNGFQDELSFLAPERLEVTGISLWDKKESAEAYNRTTYPEVLKSLSRVIDGTPEVRTFEVSSSTFHQTATGHSI
jgi:heme-degrading monooxygenase HmoA